MLNSKNLTKIIFFDIECVPEEESFFDMTPRKQELFKQRFKTEWEKLGLGNQDRYFKEVQDAVRALDVPSEANISQMVSESMEADERVMIEALYNNKAALYAEFGKVICISMGWIDGTLPDDSAQIPPTQELFFKTKSFYGDDEKKLLSQFYEATKSVIDKTLNPSHFLIGHNALNYDVPFLAKRFIINILKLPTMFDLEGKKEWNTPYLLDSRRVWAMNVYDGGCSLDLLCEVLGVPSPKDGGIAGKDVRDFYYIKKDLKGIVDYCSRDVHSLALCYLRMKSMSNTLTLL